MILDQWEPKGTNIYNHLFLLIVLFIFFFLLHSQQVFTSGWALKEKEKTHQREPVKRISPQVKHLLKSMFHTGTANPRQKLNAQQMHEELLKRVELGEIEENDVPKVTTITNWISTFSRKWKEAMALCSLEENGL